jgi:hypothetical protein
MNYAATSLITPYHQLVQRNGELLMRFWTSPDVLGQLRSATENLTREAQASALKLFQSGAFSTLTRELLGSYGRFWADIMQAQVENAVDVQQRTLNQAAAAATEGGSALRRAA